MVMTKDVKERLIHDLRIHESDTGSPEVQVALLTERINHLSGHLKEHKKTTRRAEDYLRWSVIGRHCLNICRITT